MINNVCGIVVTFNIGQRYLNNFESTVPQVDKLIIVDNGSDARTVQLLKKIQASYPLKVTLVLNSTNIGLARAQNIGINLALNEGFPWIFFLDHDSRPSRDMVRQMIISYQDYPEKGRIGIIAPYLKDVNIAAEPRYLVSAFNVFFKRICFGGPDRIDNALFVISSGSLMPAEIFNKIGRFREDFFIDYIDSEFCMRLVSSGFRIMVVKKAVLEHELGCRKNHRFLGMTHFSTNHSPERRYTIYRNRIFLWKKYLFRVPSYVLYDISAAFYDIFRIAMFEKCKAAKLKQAFRGALAGLSGNIR